MRLRPKKRAGHAPGDPSVEGDDAVGGLEALMEEKPTARGRRKERVKAPKPILHPKRNRLLDRMGWYEISEDAILTSTRQAEALNPALVATHPPMAGPPLGADLANGQPITCSPHELYNAEPRRTTSPNVVILGDVGSGKSSLAKCQYCLRPLALGVQVVVFDRKRDEGGRGEYGRVAEATGKDAAVIRFDRSGGAVINVLDPRIATQSRDAGEDTEVGQDALLVMVATHAHGELNSYSRAALRAAHEAALRSAKQDRASGVATIRDVIDHLFAPTADAVPRAHLLEQGIVTVEDLTKWGLALALDLERFVNGDLSGLIDTETHAEDGGELDLTAPLLIVDTSALGEDSPGLSLVMAIMATYLSSVWSSTKGQRIILIEEGYHTVRLAGVANVFRSLAKRGRGIGLSVVTVFHHVSDVPDTSDAMALIRESGIAHVYSQDKSDDAVRAVELFGLPEGVRDQLPVLEPGTHIMKIGSETPRLVTHDRTDLEVWATYTDDGMGGSKTQQNSPAPFQSADQRSELAGIDS